MSDLQKTVTIVLASLALIAIVYLIMAYNDGSTNNLNTMPHLRMPNIDLPDINLPDIDLPNIKMPNIEMPDLQVPKVKMSIETFEDYEDFEDNEDKEYFEDYEDKEDFINQQAPSDSVSVGSGSMNRSNRKQNVDASESIQYIEQPQGLMKQSGTGSQMNQLPSECYPKDVLSSADLLPRDANSLWAQVSPSGQGSLADQNFLTSGFHIGINTVGQTLRNANRQLRSEPLNPQVKVSPWQQTTIEPDINRRPLEIEGNL